MAHDSLARSLKLYRRNVCHSNSQPLVVGATDLGDVRGRRQLEMQLGVRVAKERGRAPKRLNSIRLTIDGGGYDVAQRQQLLKLVAGMGNDNLAYVSPMAATRWLDALGRAFIAKVPASQTMWFVTCLDRNWHCGHRTTELPLQTVVSRLHRRFRGLSYLLTIEYAYVANLKNSGGVLVMPHAHGIVWGSVSERRFRALGKAFSGGISGSRGVVKQEIYDLPGALAYAVKYPIRSYRAVMREPERQRLELGSISQRASRRLLRVLGDLTWPDLTIAGGGGLEVLAWARNRLGWEKRLRD